MILTNQPSSEMKTPTQAHQTQAAEPEKKPSNWYFDKIDLRRTKSILDGISYENEQRYRREGARFIIKVGSKMNLRYDTMATGVVYFHRFYMCHSFKQFPRWVTASCCLFLAGKVEETPKKCKDIIKTAKSFLSDKQFEQFKDDPKEEVLTLERILLQTICFDLQVDHPYGYLLKYAKALHGDKEKLQKMVQMAWTFINDSLCTTICLQWEPEIIAIALMFLAGKLSKFEVVDWDGREAHHQKWWDVFVEDITVELLEDICHQVLDLYSIPMPDTPQDSPPSSPSRVPPALPGGLPLPPQAPQSASQQAPTIQNASQLQQSSTAAPMVISPIQTTTGVTTSTTSQLNNQISSIQANQLSGIQTNAFRFPKQFTIPQGLPMQASAATAVGGQLLPPPPPPPPVPTNLTTNSWEYQQYLQAVRPHGFVPTQPTISGPLPVFGAPPLVPIPNQPQPPPPPPPPATIPVAGLLPTNPSNIHIPPPKPLINYNVKTNK